MEIASLGSGSRGNATLLRAGDTLLLVDCGFSLKETERRLQRLNVAPEQLAAVLVTHEHTDHCSGVGRLSRRYKLPVFMSHGTYASERCSDVHSLTIIRSETVFSIGSVQVTPVAVPHDSREPCQYVFAAAGKRFGVLTDLGSITALVTEQYRNCEGLLLECNHDAEMLQEGPYPMSLKRRVAGDWGHLNNEQAAEFLGQIAGSHLQQVVIAHISEKNNAKERAMAALERHYKHCETLLWATQDEGFDWIKLQ